MFIYVREDDDRTLRNMTEIYSTCSKSFVTYVILNDIVSIDSSALLDEMGIDKGTEISAVCVQTLPKLHSRNLATPSSREDPVGSMQQSSASVVPPRPAGP